MGATEATSSDAKVTDLYGRVLAVQESSALRLRSLGRIPEARQAERFAATARVQLVTARASRRDVEGAIVEIALEGAIDLLCADFGNIQFRDSAGKLRIVAHHGFTEDFLDHFAAVDDRWAACGRAAREQAPVAIADVKADIEFAPHRAIAAASGFRAVQSFPLIDEAGLLRGVLSTHFRRPGRPPPHLVRVAAIYGRLLADALPRP